MRIQESELDENKMTTSPIKKYDRDLLIQIGNQPTTVFTVPPPFFEIAKEVGLTSPTRSLSLPDGSRNAVPIPLSRGNCRNGGLGGGLYGGSINSNGNAGGFGTFGRLLVPPPPPVSREPKAIITTRTHEKLLPSNPNAWKPGRLKQRSKDEQPKSEEEARTENIVKDTRSILNKLTPENFDRLMEKFLKLPLENKENRVSAVINVLFEKAIDEPAFSAAYAKMVYTVCCNSAETSSIFRKQILDKCQTEFQKSDTEEDTLKKHRSKLEEATDPEQKEQISADIEELRQSMRKRSLGNVRFIGELYKLQMLTPKIMVSCVKMLLGDPDDEKLECLCKLLTTVGQKLDDQLKESELKAKQQGKPHLGPKEKLMDTFFVTLDKYSEDKRFSSRIRFALMDVVELRQNAWKPRRQATGPKTIQEVHRDAYLQELEEKQKIQSLPPLSPEGPPGRGGRAGTPPLMPHVPKKTDWTTVNKAARFQRKPSDRPASKPFAPPSSHHALGQLS